MCGTRGKRLKAALLRMVPWCSGLAYVPVKDEIAGSNPVGTADARSTDADTGRDAAPQSPARVGLDRRRSRTVPRGEPAASDGAALQAMLGAALGTVLDPSSDLP